jgi:hypothetical protein
VPSLQRRHAWLRDDGRLTLVNPLPLYTTGATGPPFSTMLFNLLLLIFIVAAPAKKKGKCEHKATIIPKDKETMTLTLFVRLNKSKDGVTGFRTKRMTEQQFRLDVVSVLTVRKMMDPQNTILPDLSEGRTSQGCIDQTRVNLRKNTYTSKNKVRKSTHTHTS